MNTVIKYGQEHSPCGTTSRRTSCFCLEFRQYEEQGTLFIQSVLEIRLVNDLFDGIRFTKSPMRYPTPEKLEELTEGRFRTLLRYAQKALSSFDDEGGETV